MKNPFKLLALAIIFVGFSSFFAPQIKAVSFEYPSYNVDININSDSSFNVKEEVVYNVYGDFHGLRRNLTLADPQRDVTCKNGINIYCGGFDRVVVNKVTDLNGNDITSKIKLYKVTDDSNAEALRIEWELFADGEVQNGERFGWVLYYTIYGGIFNVQNNPYFYWNLLPEEKSGIVYNSTVNINLPSTAKFKSSSLENFISTTFKQSNSGNTISYKFTNIPSYAPITMSYKFEPGEVLMPGAINYTINPAFGYKVFLDNVDITDQANGLIKSVSQGTRKVRFEHIGYEPLEQDVVVKAGTTEFIEVKLQAHPWMQALIILSNLTCLCGVILIPGFLIMVYWFYKRKGTDKDMPKTIIPLFNPPKNFAPYLAGSLVDEKVDKRDVVGSIIDLAYKGFIKIQEITKDKNYRLTKSKEDTTGLNAIELQIFNAIFKSGDEVETKKLVATFAIDYVSIQNNIYKEMVSLGFFKRSPVATIGIYLSLGVFSMISGFVLFAVVSVFLVEFLGIFIMFTPALALAFMGIAFIIAAKYMPAKTSSGSKLYAEVLGFKMYMQTAEKYTVQKLEPEDFVKYLSYAIVFGIEKDWGKKFEGIYKGVPDWYQGTGNIYDAIWISNFANSFSNSTIQNIAPISSGSSSGKGWSGGGSFGGFSGGGGGGGSSGGW